MTENKPISAVRSLQIVYAALMAGIIMFAGVSIMLNLVNGPSLKDPSISKILFIIALISLSAIPIGIALFNRKIEEVRSEKPEIKLSAFREAMVTRAALMEASAFFSIVGFMLTGFIYFALTLLIVLLVMAYFFPGIEKIASVLEISTYQLENPSQIL